jgi:hypothetical protein
MRVVLIATNRHDRLMSRMAARPLPLGIASVAGALAAAQHVVKTVGYITDTAMEQGNARCHAAITVL